MVITAGPTHEPIDPVRYIANRSSGKQGYALAEVARDAGAEVVLVSGPVNLPPPAGVRLISVETAREMAEAVESTLPCDIFIAAAAVADWRTEADAAQKIKKGFDGPPALKMVENPDILASIARHGANRPRLVIGFAAETENVVAHARAKLAKKGCDLIVANDVGEGTGVMGGSENAVVLITPDGEQAWPRLAKDEVARRLVAHFAQMYAAEEERGGA